jgi:carbamate kinase
VEAGIDGNLASALLAIDLRAVTLVLAPVCRFVERTGARAVIRSLDRIDELLSGRAGTQVLPRGPELQHGERKAWHDRAA